MSTSLMMPSALVVLLLPAAPRTAMAMHVTEGGAARDMSMPNNNRSLSSVYTPPTSYTADLSFHIPYIPFTENLKADVDVELNGGSMRLSYYSGTDVFIDSKAGPSYKIVPVGTDMTCLNTTSCVDANEDPISCRTAGARVTPLWQHLFPNDMSLFVQQLDATGAPTTATIQRCRRYASQYSFDPATKGRGGACVPSASPPPRLAPRAFTRHHCNRYI
jgi:hypothetical protein